MLDLITPEATALDMEIVRVRIMGGRKPCLQIMAEKSGDARTDVAHCVSLSRAVSALLDVEDPIKDKYTLEVSTPGIDRPLTRAKDFARWIGQAAKLELSRPLDNRRRFQGVLTAEEAGQITLLLDDETELVADISELAKAQLILTDQLIEAAQNMGHLPPQGEDLSEFDIDDRSEERGSDMVQEGSAEISGEIR